MSQTSNIATTTVRHVESAEEIRTLSSHSAWRVGVDIYAEVEYEAGDTATALAAVDRIATSLRKQIADAAESSPR